MIITSVVLLVGAVAILIIGATQGNPTLLGVSLGAAAAGALALLAGNASARRIALARGVPVEAVLASRVRRSPPTTEAAPTEPPTPPPIDGYDDMTAAEITRLVASGAMPDEALSDMLVYEATHRRRRDVLTALMDVVGPEPAPAPEQTVQAGHVRRRLRGGRAESGAGPAAEALQAARQATLTDDQADDSRFARPDAD